MKIKEPIYFCALFMYIIIFPHIKRNYFGANYKKNICIYVYINIYMHTVNN